jgi:hypothetical protein
MATILVDYILLFSRIAMADAQVFVTLVAETAKSKGVPEADIWEVIMSQWWNRVSDDFAHTPFSSLANVCHF